MVSTVARYFIIRMLSTTMVPYYQLWMVRMLICRFYLLIIVIFVQFQFSRDRLQWCLNLHSNIFVGYCWRKTLQTDYSCRWIDFNTMVDGMINKLLNNSNFKVNNSILEKIRSKRKKIRFNSIFPCLDLCLLNFVTGEFNCWLDQLVADGKLKVPVAIIVDVLFWCLDVHPHFLDHQLLLLLLSGFSLLSEWSESSSLLVALVKNGGFDGDYWCFLQFFCSWQCHSIGFIHLSIVQITLVFGRLGVHGFTVSVNLLKIMVSKSTCTSCARCTRSNARGSLSGAIYCYRIFHSLRLMLVNPSLLITFADTAWFHIIFTWVFARWEGIF